jgi:hypothetical protein
MGLCDQWLCIRLLSEYENLRVRFARSIRTNDGSEVGVAKEECMVALVRFEVEQLQSDKFTHGEIIRDNSCVASAATG